MFRWISFTTIALGLAIVSGCDRGNSGTAGDGGKMRIAVIPKSMGGDFWETVRKGADTAAKDLDVDMRFQGTLSETDIAEQNKIVENMVNLGVKGIALAPLNFKASKDAVENANMAKIPVVVFDSDVDTPNRVSYVATDNNRGGQIAAEHMLKLLGDKKGKVIVLRYLQGTGSTEARAKGFIDTAKAGGLNVVADVYPSEGSTAGSKKAATNVLENFVTDKKLQVDGIFACNLYSALGMLGALDDLRKSGVEVNTHFIGFDSSTDLVKALQDGRCAALVSQNPERMGYLAVETLVKHLRGEKVDPNIDTGAELVTKERLENDKAIRALVGLKE